MAAHYARRCGEPADDLEQEAWLGLLEGLELLDPAIGQPEFFLIQRARFRLLDSVRRARRRRHEPLDEEPALALPAEEAPLGDFFALLGETQRQIALYLLDGLTFREAGDALGCSSANIAYHARKLREVYRGWSAGHPEVPDGGGENVRGSLAAEAAAAIEPLDGKLATPQPRRCPVNKYHTPGAGVR